MGGVPEPERPTGWMRAVLGLVLAAIASWTALPIILIVALLVAFGLTCGAALSLEHVGALDDPEAFKLAHWMALVPLGLFFAIAYGRRLLLKSGGKDEASLPLRWPALTACVTLPVAALFMGWAAWDTQGVASLAGAVILANLFSFSLGSLLAMLYVAGVAFWLVYSWAAASKLCILHAVGARGCPLGDLPERLGLSPTLVGAADESLSGLLGTGWLSREEDVVTRTEDGGAWLARRLGELGVG